MDWHKVEFTETQIEKQGMLAKLEDQFLKIFMKAEDNTDMAVLADSDYEHGRVGIYFSPACSPDCDTLIRFYEGRECDPPARELVVMVAGDDDVIDSLE